MGLSFGQVGLLAGVAFFGSQEIERKLRQRREDPSTFRETPIVYIGGIFLGLGALSLSLAAQQKQTAGLARAPSRRRRRRRRRR